MKLLKSRTSIVFVLFTVILIVFSQPLNAQSSHSLLILAQNTDDPLIAHLSLDTQFTVTVSSSFPTDISSYEAIVLIDYVVPFSNLPSLTAFDGGLLFFIGPHTVANLSTLQGLGLTSSTEANFLNDKVLPSPTDANTTHPIISNIAWNSVTTIVNYTDITFSGVALVTSSPEDEHANVPLIIKSGDAIIYNFLITPAFNKEFIEWPYFNYLLYLSLEDLLNEQPESYASWRYSPVPHTPTIIALGVAIFLTSGITIIAYLYTKRYSRKHTITEKDLEEISKEIKVSEEWEKVGLHRQLGGFLLQFFVGLLIVLPNVVMTSLVFPLFVLPSPQAVGFYDFTLHFFEGIWLLFDLGTSVAMVKFFSEHRVKRPEYAIRYVQIFVWYQMISGTLQLVLISFIGAIVFPHTFLAHMTWVFVTHAFFQWPAFFLVFLFFFQAMNRHDYYQLINLLLYGIFNITLQYLVIVLFRVTLGKNIIFGSALAGAIGYSVGNYVIQAASFLVGLWLFKRLGFSLKSIFRVDFTWKEVKEALTFGLKWTLGNVWPPLIWFLQMFLLSFWLPNYTQQQGYFSLAWNFAQIVMLVALFGQSMLPGISESYHAKKKTLTRYYTVASLKWAAFFDLFFVAALLAIGPKFILGGAGVEWKDAAIIFPWLMLFHFFGYWSWLGDWMFAGSDRPGWAAISWIIEQGIRGILLASFIPLYSFFDKTFNSPLIAVMFAYIPALVVKNIFMWWQIRRNDYFKFAWKDLMWQGLVAPILAGAILYGILAGLFSFIWQGEIITSVVILLIGLLGGIYVFGFIYGLLGGFDNNTLVEFEHASGLAKGVLFMTKPLYKVCAFGAKLSPLHNKFPISIYADAAKEAEILTSEKKQLVI